MREDKNRYDRVSRRSSTGTRKGSAERDRRERIRVFDDTDDFYQNENTGERYSETREQPRRDSYESDRRYDEDRYYESDRPGERDRYREDRRYEDDRRYDRDDRRDDDRRYDRDDRRDDDRRREGRQRADRREERNTPRKQAGGNRRRRAGGDTERFVHQIVPYAMFWVALFGAVSFILRDLIGLDGSTGAFGNWFANFLCGLFGSAAYLLPLFFVVIALRWKKFVREGILARKLLLSTSFVTLLAGIIHVFLDANRGDVDTALLFTTGALRTSGGVFGGFVGEYMGYILYLPGTILLAIPLLLIIGIYLVGLTPGGLWQRIVTKCKQIAERRRRRDQAKYDGKESRALRVPSRKSVAAQSKKEQLTSSKNGDGNGQERPRYIFRDEEDEPMPRRAAEPKAAEQKTEQQHSIELVDIPDDEEIDEELDEATAILERAGQVHSTDRRIEDILRELEQQEEREPTQPTEEERPLQGSYYAPFALPVRPEPKHGQASAEASQATAATAFGEVGKEQSLHGKTTIGPLGSIDNIHAAPQKREEVLGDGPVAQNAVESDADRAAFVTFDDEAQLAPSAAFEPEEAPVIFERERLDDRRPAATAFAEPQPARTAEVPQPSFAFDKAEDEADTATDEIGEALDVASRVRTAFALSDEEEVTETASAAHQAAPREERYAADAMRQAPRVVAHAEPVQDEKPAPTPPPAPREYRLPPISLLNEDKAIKDDDHSEENQQKIDILRRTLESFNVHIKEEVICSRGPTITRYEVRPEIGVPVRSIMNRIDDISLYMEAQVRIAPIQGKAAVGVEVPNKVRETVYLRTLLESEPFKRSKNPVEVALGVGIGGHIQMCDLTAMPHLLVAGATKSGKSVCINTIILSLLYKTSPKDLRLILIDPKRVEFKPYMHLPHLYAPIITETTHAVGALACAVREMERRYTLLEDVGARNFEAYNEKVKNDSEREHLPYLVIIIDEYYDLKMACPNNDLENFACRLAQKARAAGIHLIIGTQRPSVNVITGTLKANIPSRIAFTVMQQVDSRTILDAVGAELLTGRGDMLYAPMGEKPIRLQGSFVSDDEVESVVTFVRERNDPVQYNQAFMEQIEIEVARAANAGKKSEDFDEFAEDEDTDVDPKFYDAVVLAVQTQKVATSLLQRRLGVGYGRAAKIIDRMEELGLVTPAEGNKPRKLLPAAQGYLDHVADLDGEEDGGDFDTDGNY